MLVGSKGSSSVLVIGTNPIGTENILSSAYFLVLSSYCVMLDGMAIDSSLHMIMYQSTVRL